MDALMAPPGRTASYGSMPAPTNSYSAFGGPPTGPGRGPPAAAVVESQDDDAFDPMAAMMAPRGIGVVASTSSTSGSASQAPPTFKVFNPGAAPPK